MVTNVAVPEPQLNDYKTLIVSLMHVDYYGNTNPIYRLIDLNSQNVIPKTYSSSTISYDYNALRTKTITKEQHYALMGSTSFTQVYKISYNLYARLNKNEMYNMGLGEPGFDTIYASSTSIDKLPGDWQNLIWY